MRKLSNSEVELKKNALPMPTVISTETELIKYGSRDHCI